MPAMVRSEALRPEAAAARRDAVVRAEAYLLAHLDTPVPVSSLSRIVGLSERGLRNAFYSVRGMSPKRWMIDQRLHGARHALRGGAGPATVTDVAATYGFFELGRFAALYRKAFGEAPSDTLRSNGRTASTADQWKRTRQCLRQPARQPVRFRQ
jgi:AraC family ethanolamine operon transcriptional activator